ncbi:MAG: phage tail tape measure protein [Rhodocyclaceae bacterium]|nr:phage tail tape measure protein [Rhodocyclaceae bacterium]
MGLSVRINVEGQAAKVKVADLSRTLAELKARLGEVKAAGEAARLKGDLIQTEALKAAGAEIAATIAKLGRLKEAERLDAARQILDVRPFREIEREIERARAAFERLKASGRLSGAELGQAYASLQTKINELKSQTNGWAESFDRIKGAVAATAGAFAAVGGAVKIAAGFEAAMVDFARATGQTKDEAMALADEFRRLAQTYGITAEAVAGIATVGGKMGIAREEVGRFVDTVAQAAINFDMLPEEAARALATLSAVLKIPVGELDAFAGAINAVADSVGVMERDVIEALTRAGASAQALGLSREQAAAMAAAMIRLGASSETAGSSIRTFSMRLRSAINDSGEAGRALQMVVGDVRAFAQLLYTDGQQAVAQFFAALNRMPAPDRFAAIKAIFQEGLDTETIAKLAEGVETYGKALAAAGGDAESFRRQLAELTGMKLGTTQQEFKNLWQAVRNLADAVGQNLLPIVRMIAGALNGIATALRSVAEAAPAFSTLAVVAGAIAVAFAPLRALFGGLAILLGRLGMSSAALGTLVTAGGALLRVFMRFVPIVGGATLAIEALMLAYRKMAGGGEDAAAANAAALRKLAESGRIAAENIKRALDESANVVADRLKAALERAGNAAKALGEDFKAAEGAIKESLARQIAQIEAAGQRRLAAAKLAAQGETQEAVAAARAVIQTEREKLQAAEAAGRQMLSAWQRTHGEMARLAQAAGQDVASIEREGLQAKVAIYAQIETAYRKTIDTLIAEEQRLLAEARRIDEERAAFKLGVEDRIRALMQRGMSEIDAYADRWRQVDEKQAAAQAALAAGHFEQAKKLAEQAMQLAESNVRAIKDGSNTLVSEQQAAARAIGEVTEAARIADAAMKAMADARRAQAGEAGREAAEMQRGLEEVSRTLDGLQATLAKGIDLKITADAKALADAASEIVKLKEAAAGIEAAKKRVAELEDAIKRLKDAGGAVEITLKTGDVERALAEAKAKVEAAGIQANVGFDNARAELEKFRAEIMGRPSTHTVAADTTRAQAEISRLQQPTSSTHTVYVRTVEMRANGGMVGMAGGGRVFGPGTSTSDSIPAMLSAGEYVIRASSVRKYGAALLDAINSGILPMPVLPRYAFAAGGLVGDRVTREPARDVVDINIAIGARQARVTGARDQAMALATALRELSRGA